MNKQSLLSITALAMIMLVGCENPITPEGPKEDIIKVESVTWKADLKSGTQVCIDDKSLNVANRMDIVPANATNQNQTFDSSDKGVATVSPNGQVTPITIGTTTITVYVDEKSDSFILNVVEPQAPPVIEVESISVSEPNITLSKDEEKSLITLFTILPDNATDKTVTYKSSDDKVVSVTESGIIKGLKEGSAKISISSVSNTKVIAEINVTITPFYGDYPRNTWSISLDPIGVVTSEVNNSIDGVFDENYDSFLGIVKPGKTWKDVTNSESYVHFILDMKEEMTFNYFRLRHRNKTDVFLRFRKFTEISGSNNGKDFTVIATDVAIPYETAAEVFTPNIALPESTYRYIKFLAASTECWDTAKGSTVQINELYIGREAD